MKKTLKTPTVMLVVILLLAMTTSTIALTPLKTVAADSNSINKLSRNRTDKISVVALFFPIYEFVRVVGGDRIDASVLISIGSEPHDFDPTIQEVQKANSANLLVYF